MTSLVISFDRNGLTIYVKRINGIIKIPLSSGESCWIVEERVCFWEDIMSSWSMPRYINYVDVSV